jgi:thiosulfate dehydrogenase (quinone) large subunit
MSPSSNKRHIEKRPRPRASARGQQALAAPRFASVQSDRPISGFAILPLRLFLGVTFIYAALQKIFDPGFFHAGSPTYIGAQILAFSRGSPIQALLHHLMQFAVPVGLLTVGTEGSIGLLILLGLFTRPAALVGMALSMGFFLSASWNTYPYFFGSDIVFVVCWLTMAMTGPSVLALDPVVEAPLSRAIRVRAGGARVPTFWSALMGWQTPLRPMTDEHSADAVGDSGRTLPAQPPRRLLTRGETMVGSLATLGLIALGLHPRAGSNAGATGLLAGSGKAPPGSRSAAPTSGASTPPPSRGPTVPAGAKKIGNISQVPVNSAGTVTDPKTGDPAVIVHTSGSNFYAYDAVCTHAGCTVQYDPQQKVLVCPCHGGTFDPAHGAQVVAGPPPSPLNPIDMTIDAHGNIYIV